MRHAIDLRELGSFKEIATIGVMHWQGGYLPPLVQRLIALLTVDAAENFSG